MFNFENFEKMCEEVVRHTGARRLDPVHAEYVLATEPNFRNVFTEIANTTVYNDLLSTIEDSMNECDKAPAALIRAHGKNYPVSMTQGYFTLKEDAEKISQERFVCPSVQYPHVFLAILNLKGSNAQYCCIKDFFGTHGISIDDFFAAYAEATAAEIGVNLILTALTTPAGMPGMNDGMPSGQDWHEFCTDLTVKAKEYKKPFIGRQDIIDRTIQVLARMDKSNPVLVGEPGVGKTAITIGLAKLISEDKVPVQIKDHKLYSVDLAAMIAGTKYRGEFEARLTNLLKGAEEEGKCILFFDELHTVIGAGSTSGQMDASNILKPYLTTGSIKFIGATTYKEFKHIENDSALMRRFQKVDVVEPSVEDTIKILQGLKGAYEDYHHVKYDDDAIEAAVQLTARHIFDRFLPDKAIDMIDEAGAYQSIHEGEGAVVSKDNIEDVISTLCKIPKKTFSKDAFATVRALSDNLKSKVFGQDEAIDKVVRAIKLAKSGLGSDETPVGSFVFMGPTGTGKTELAKQIAKAMAIDFVRFDMSEYMEENSVSKLIGTSAGYVGYDDGGLLVEAIRKTPNCVLLLDEIEKAHPAVFNVFLQVLSNAKLTDNKGRVADFKNVVIIMTSNVGARDAYNHKSLGFGSDVNDTVDTSLMGEAYKHAFSPEFRNRITDVIQFNPIDEKIGRMVAEKELKALDIKLSIQGIKASYTDACIDALVKKGVSPEYGAREIQRIIDNDIKVQFVDFIVDETKAKSYTVDYVDDKFVVAPVKAKKTKKEAVKA